MALRPETKSTLTILALILAICLPPFGYIVYVTHQLPGPLAATLRIVSLIFIFFYGSLLYHKITHKTFSKKAPTSTDKRITKILNSRIPQNAMEFYTAFGTAPTLLSLASLFRVDLAQYFNVPPEQVRTDEPISTFRKNNKSIRLSGFFGTTFFHHSYLHDTKPLALTLYSPWWNEKITQILKSDSVDLAYFIRFVDEVNKKIALALQEFEDHD